MLTLLVFGCNENVEEQVESASATATEPVEAPSRREIDTQPPPPPDPATISESVNWEIYPFLNTSEGILGLYERFEVPSGYERMELEPGSFGAWLRGLPTLERTSVFSYRGQPIDAPSAGVVPMNIGFGDIQQCADSILRLYSEYLWVNKQSDNWGIHFTSGDLSSWKKWRMGQRFEVSGSKVKTIQTGQVDNSYEQYQKWMHHSFIYAGTRSLHHDAKTVPVGDEIKPGDFFVSPGSPGHAILVLDIAVARDRPPIALLGQGYMPAQDFHVLKDSGDHMVGAWFVLPTDKDAFLINPSWYGLPRTGVYRF